MLGIVFTEFQTFVEAIYGVDTYEDMLDQAQDLPSKGIYTAVGKYSHEEILTLVTTLSSLVHQPVPDLVKAFGTALFGAFYSKYPGFFDHIDGAYGFLETIENHIHIEVKKLYSEAMLPTFDSQIEEGGKMKMVYRSPRPFADLAEGLIRGCADHYQETIELERRDIDVDDGYMTEFRLHKVC